MNEYLIELFILNCGTEPLIKTTEFRFCNLVKVTGQYCTIDRTFKLAFSLI